MSTTNWPRTDSEISFTGAYTCTHHNDRERAACPVCLVTTLTAERDQLRACLRDLVDEQNGAPLELRRRQWQAAMDEALAALTKTEDAT